MTKIIDELSVFFPAFNEEGNIKSTLVKAVSVLNKIADKWEIIVINDGSYDRTKQIVEDLVKKEGRIKLINHPQNMGYGETLKSGYYASKYPWIVMTDSDGQFEFSDVVKLLEKRDKADIVVGYRLNRQDSLLRKINGWGWTFLANLLLGIGVRDVDCSFKLVKKEVIDKIPHLESTRGGMISPELLAKAKKAGFKIVEVPVHHYPRISGKQTGAGLKVIIKSFVDLFRLWKKLL